MCIDRVVRREHDGPLDAVAEFANIARPVVGQHRLHGLGRECADSAARFIGKPVQKVTGQGLNVFGPPA